METVAHIHHEAYEYPSLVRRFQSTTIDILVKLALFVVFAQIIGQFSSFPIWARATLFASILLYEPLCLTYGCTVGNFLLGIRVRQFGDDSKKLNLLQAIIRYAVKIFLGWISFLTIHSNTEKRAIHDMAASSVMIQIR